MRLLFALAVASLLSVSTSLAQSPPDSLLTGSMSFGHLTQSGALCVSQGGPSDFKRSGTGVASISFPEIVYSSFADRRQAYRISGVGQLSFITARRGYVFFDNASGYPVGIRRPQFYNYTQTFDSASGVLKVSFKVVLNSCTVPIKAIFRL